MKKGEAVVTESERGYLNKEEKGAIELHGSYHQALAIQSFEQLIQQPDATVEAIRQLDDKTIRRVRKHLAKAVKAMGITTEALDVPEEPAVETSIEAFVEPEPVIVSEPNETAEAIVLPASEPKPSEPDTLTLQQRRLQEFTSTDIAQLDTSDAGRIAQLLLAHYPQSQNPKRMKINYLQSVTMFLDGRPLSEIAESQNTSAASIRQTLHNIFGKLKFYVPNDFDLSDQLAAEQASEQPEEKPKPRPVVPSIRLVAPLVEQEPQDASYDNIIRNAIDMKKSGLVTPSEWRKAAEDKLREVAKDRLSCEEIDGLWARVHVDLYDNAQAHKQPVTDEQRTVLEKLGLGMRDKFTTLNAIENTVQLAALRPFLNTSMGVQDLDRVHYVLRSKYKGMTLELAQRFLVDGLIKVLA